jgi:acetyl-CoA acetyltransferase
VVCGAVRRAGVEPAGHAVFGNVIHTEIRDMYPSRVAAVNGRLPGVNDAAAALVLADAGFASRRGLEPLGRLVAYTHAGVEPRIMVIGPVPAVRKVLDSSGPKVDEIDVFEVNEAFAAQALAVVRELGLPLPPHPRRRPVHRRPAHRRHRGQLAAERLLARAFAGRRPGCASTRWRPAAT